MNYLREQFNKLVNRISLLDKNKKLFIAILTGLLLLTSSSILLYFVKDSITSETKSGKNGSSSKELTAKNTQPDSPYTIFFYNSKGEELGSMNLAQYTATDFELNMSQLPDSITDREVQSFKITDKDGDITIVSENMIYPGYILESNSIDFGSSLSNLFIVVKGGKSLALNLNGESLQLDAPYEGIYLQTSKELKELAQFDRETLASTQLNLLLTKVELVFDLPETLTDFTAPVLTELTPSSEESFSSAEISLTGLVEPGAKLKINGKDVEVGYEGRFSYTYLLSEGENEVTFEMTDKFGNQSKESKVYTYTVPVVQTPPQNNGGWQGGGNNNPSPQPTPTPEPTPAPTTPPVYSCGGANQELLNLINAHRAENGKGALGMNSALNNAACGHSIWMSQNGTLSHTGSGGSTFSSRCVESGTTCYGENVGQHGAPSASIFFEMWKASPTHNAIMLGNFSQIGIGFSGQYITTDFR